MTGRDSAALPDGLRAAVADSYGIDPAGLQFVAAGRDASRRFYAFDRAGTAYVLRVEAGGGDRLAQARAELDWQRYLAGCGLPVAVPLPAADGALAVAAQAEGEACILSACTRVSGQPCSPDDPALWNDAVFAAWGRTMARLHLASRGYAPPPGQARRPEFASIIRDTVQAFPQVDRAAQALMADIQALSRGAADYGLIHYDLHPANFLVDGDEINVFDFADCAYGWYTLDIGCALTVGLWLAGGGAGHDFADGMIRAFLAGYRSARALESDRLAQIPLFMRLCQLAAFSHMYTREDPADAAQREAIECIVEGVAFRGLSDDLFCG